MKVIINKFKENKILRNLTVLLLVIIIFSFTFISLSKNDENYINLTQLKTNTPQQMMGYFITTKSGKVIVIDGGNIGDSSNLQKYINETSGKVDYWFLTHYHIDHTGAISDIIKNSNIEIKNIVCSFCDREMVVNYEPKRLDQYDIVKNALDDIRVNNNIINPKEGMIFNIDGVKIKIISTYQNDITNNLGNNTSMVFKLYVNDKSVLFLGDTAKESSEKLLEYHSSDLKSDYVQMSHHGQNGATYELYEKISPKYALWPTPQWLWDNDNGNGYNTGDWKTLEVRKWMENLGVYENYIQKDGDITLKIF